jgi:hypothetical protein
MRNLGQGLSEFNKGRKGHEQNDKGKTDNK